MDRLRDIVKMLPSWKLERLPPPRVNQSQVSHLCHPDMQFKPNRHLPLQYDKVSLSCEFKKTQIPCNEGGADVDDKCCPGYGLSGMGRMLL